jgi:endonuclease/exonuclease/phosphatase family metal-dependent hydrolase
MVNSPYGTIPFTCATTAFYMTHHGYKRERQMPALNEFARGRVKTDFPAILVGDFNTDPESAEIRYLRGLQSLEGVSAYWCDAWDHAGDGSKGTTWSKNNDFAAWAPWPNRRIDYIFVAQPQALCARAAPAGVDRIKIRRQLPCLRSFLRCRRNEQ